MAEYLYIHIPFCIRKCVYCDFYSIPFDAQRADDYIDALCREMDLRKESARDLRAVYMGGGTPGMLPDEGIAKILDTAREAFSIRAGAEITVETNPGKVSVHRLEMLRGAGVNRISLGVQSLQDRGLAVLGRSHTANDALVAVHEAREAGFDNISIDLMYGIPGQTMEEWEDTVSKAVELDPEHISAYELTPEKDTPLYKGIERGSITMPDEALVTEMYYGCIESLGRHGYGHYEISNFAKPGHECIHNLNYWDRGEYLGVGAGAHSFLSERRSGNVKDIDRYIGSIARGVVPADESLDISGVERAKELIFLGLRKTAGLDVRRVPDGERLLESAVLDELVGHGFVEKAGDFVRLTKKGLVLSNEVILRIFRLYE